MTRTAWTWMTATVLVITPLAATGGCGSDSDAPAVTADDGGTSGQDGTSTSDGSATCTATGGACTAGTQCCSTRCENGTCQEPVGSCSAANAACTVPTECCTRACIGGKCAATQCTSDNEACTSNEQCCGGKCDGGKCTPLSTTCKTTGNACGQGTECCSGHCSGGICSDVSFCTQQGDVCAGSAECCGGNCVKAAGAALGTCGATVSATGVGECTPKGVVCAKAGDTVKECGGTCCSRVCAASGAAPGFLVCQPASGCAPTGELCRNDSDCCGWSGAPAYTSVVGPTNDVTCAKDTPTQEFGRCDIGLNCKEAGIICKPTIMEACDAPNNCCRPNGAPSAAYCNEDPTRCCRKDALGIPRCLLNANDCTSNPPKPGDSCATSADCCGKPCVNNKCEGACIAQGGTCTSHADCCSGSPCVIPTGSSTGTCGAATGTGSDSGTTGPCALYGQTCTVSGDCCDGVPCTNGLCVVGSVN